MCGCVPRPAHPPRPPLVRRVGAALKGLRRLGSGAEEAGCGAGVRSAVGSVTCVPHTLAPKGSTAAGPWGQQEPPLARGGGRNTQTTPPRLPSLLRAFACWDRLGRSPNPVLGPRGVWDLWMGEGAGAWSGLPIGPSVHLPPGWPLRAPPILHPGLSLLCRGCFPLPVFFPALAPLRAAWSGGGGGAPPGGRLVLPLPPPLPSDSHSPFKKSWGSHVNLGGAEEFCTHTPRFPQSGRFPTPPLGPRCAFWDPAIPALPVCCLISTLSRNVFNSSLSVGCSISALLSPHAPEVLNPQAFLV